MVESVTQDFLNQGLRYDLRQKWAELLGKSLEKIFEAREENNFPEWFRLLKNLHDDIQYKFKKEDHSRYTEVYQSILTIIKQNEYAYIDPKGDVTARGKIKDNLSELHMFLITMFDKHKLFGAQEEAEAW